jgi:hypothetical protein
VLKKACLIGVQAAFIEAGLLRPIASMEKAAQMADVAAQALPEEMQAAGEFITPEDLNSLAKILEVLAALQQNYQAMAGGGMPPQPGMEGGMPPAGPPQPGMEGGMPPAGPPQPAMGGGMPPAGPPMM